MAQERLTLSLAPAADAAGVALPSTITPRVDAQRASVAVHSGYDGAHRSGTLAGEADVRIWGPVAFRAGFTYVPSGQDQPFQPHFGLRVQLLDQRRHGVDGAVGAFYRMDRFVEDEGLVQVMAMLGRRSGALGVFANVAYGQDPEGDDRDGEVKLAALYLVGTRVNVGVDGRVRFDLFSTDSRRASRGESGLDFAAGPLATVEVGPVVLVGQVGVSGVRVVKLESGVMATAGVASLF
jgi:hypothetical protein